MRRLATFVERLLDECSTKEEQLQAALDYMASSRELAWPAATDEATHDNTALSCGQALNPESASRCVGDFMRTRSFVRGLEAAVLAAKSRFPGGRIRVLYAGCGPLAALAVPLMLRQPADEVGFTLVDIHAFSIEASKRLIGRLGLEGHVDAWIEGDATELRFPPGSRFHVIVSEVMQRALDREPQVAVTIALAPLLVPGGLLVPERITVALETEGPRLEDGAQEAAACLDAPARRRLATLFDLTADTRGPPPPTIVEVPPDPGDQEMRAVLATEIQVFGAERLGPQETGITGLKPLFELGPLEPGDRIECRYRMGADPGFSCTLLGRPAGNFSAPPNGILGLPRDAAEQLGASPPPRQILGSADLARFWDRARRARHGMASWTPEELAQDVEALARHEISLEVAMAYTFQELPSPEQFAAWVQASPRVR